MAEKGQAQIRREQNKLKIKSRNKLLVEKGPMKVRKEANEWKKESRKHKLETDPETFLEVERKKQRLSRERQRKANPGKMKEEQVRRKRKVES